MNVYEPEAPGVCCWLQYGRAFHTQEAAAEFKEQMDRGQEWADQIVEEARPAYVRAEETALKSKDLFVDSYIALCRLFNLEIVNGCGYTVVAYFEPDSLPAILLKENDEW